jgi:hypothetical protein
MVSEWILPQFCVFHQLAFVFIHCKIKVPLVKLTYYTAHFSQYLGSVMPQAVSCWPLTLQVKIWSWASKCAICGRSCSTQTGFSHSTIFLPWQYNSTNAPHSFIHPSITDAS